jgi:hypothetical protein
MSCAAAPRCTPAGTTPLSTMHSSRRRLPPARGTRRAIDCETILYIHSPRGLLRPPGSTSPHPRQPVHQDRANEFRSVVTPYACRCSTTTDHPGQDPPHIGPPQRSGRIQHQALPSIFVHQSQPLEWTPSSRPIVDEVACPSVVLEPGRLLNATVHARPRFRAEFPGFSQPQGPPQPQAVPKSPHLLEVN